MKRNSSAMYDRRYGHLLKGMIEILARGHGEMEAFILRTILVIVDMLVEIDRMEWMGLQEVESDWEF